MKIPTFALGSALWLLLTGAPTQAADYGFNLTDGAPPVKLNNSQGQHNRWSGVGYFSARRGCNASLLDTRAGDSDGPAYVLTNAHCFESSHNQTATEDTELNIPITFNNFQDTTDNQPSYAIKQINWLSLQGENLAIAELDSRLSVIVESGIQPLKLSQETVEPTRFLLVGASHHPEPLTLALKSCTFQRSNDTLAYPWIWRNALNTQCNLLSSGASGSPVLDRQSNAIVAVLGQPPAARNAHLKCMDASPCDIVDSAPQWRPNTQHAHTVENLAGCWSEGVLRPDPSYCKLFPSNIAILSPPKLTQLYLPAKAEAGLSALFPTWNLNFSITTPFYRHKVASSALECESPHGYSEAIPSGNAYINSAMGSSEGFSALCIVGAHAEHQGPFWGDLKNASALAVLLTEQGNSWEPAIMPVSFGFIRPVLSQLTLHRDPYFNVRYFAKSGPPETTYCEATEGYVEIANDAFESDTFRIMRLTQSKRHCIYSHNIRGEQSAVASYLITARQGG